MPDTDGFGVVDEEIEAHLRTVDELIARLRTAAQASEPIHAMAYGIVGQVFAVPAHVFTASASDGIGRFVQGAEGIRARLQQTASDYRETERRVTTEFNSRDGHR